MTLPSSGALSLANIQTEFGGSNPISLSEYYAGGAYVPAGTSGTYGAVPSSGAISISNFYGTQKGLDVQTVGVSPILLCGKSGCVTQGYGYAQGSGGTITDGTFNPSGGTTITGLWWTTNNQVIFILAAAVSNSGWTTMKVGSTSFSRTSATFNSGTGFSQWAWSSITSNPFGTTGNVQVVYT